MAANTFNGTAATQVANMGFSAFLERLLPLRIFTTDFSDEVSQKGTGFTTRLVGNAVAGDLQDDYSGSRRTAAAVATTTTAIQGTLSEQPCSGFHLTDEEVAQMGTGVVSDMLARKIRKHGYAVANEVLDYVFNLLTAASYAASTTVGAASAFDLADVVNLDATLAEAGWPVDIPGEIGLVLKPSYLANLKLDSGVIDLSASGIPVVQQGFQQGRQVDVFSVYQSSTLPPSGGTPESENLVGFAATPDAMAMAMRVVKPQAPERLVDFRVMKDEETGITMVYRADYSDGQMYHTFETLFGAVKANGSAAHRLKSA